jgi:hypothetical protein
MPEASKPVNRIAMGLVVFFLLFALTNMARAFRKVEA